MVSGLGNEPCIRSNVCPLSFCPDYKLGQVIHDPFVWPPLPVNRKITNENLYIIMFLSINSLYFTFICGLVDVGFRFVDVETDVHISRGFSISSRAGRGLSEHGDCSRDNESKSSSLITVPRRRTKDRKKREIYIRSKKKKKTIYKHVY